MSRQQKETARNVRVRRRTSTLVATVAAMAFVASAHAISVEEGQAVLAQIDAFRTFADGDFASGVTIITEDPEAGVTRQVVQQFRRDREDKLLMLIRAPATMLGQGYLRVDDNLWFYDPESRTFSRTSMKEQFSESDARNADFDSSTYARDYRVTAATEGRLGSFDVYILDLEAKSAEAPYASQRLWVAKSPSLPLKVEEYSESGRLMRTSLFPAYQQVGETYVASTMIFVDELVAGKKTRITLSDVSVDPLPDSIFTKAYVERVNR